MNGFELNVALDQAAQQWRDAKSGELATFTSRAIARVNRPYENEAQESRLREATPGQV